MINVLDVRIWVDKLIVCGQAMSHTVNYTLRDIVDDWEKHNLNVGNIILLEDGRLTQ